MDSEEKAYELIDHFNSGDISDGSVSDSDEYNSSPKEKRDRRISKKMSVFMENEDDRKISYNIEDVEKQIYDSRELNNIRKNIIKLFYNFDVIVFTDDFKLSFNCACGSLILRRNKIIDPDDYPGILFLSYDCINATKLYIETHNNMLLGSDTELSLDDECNHQICFDEGEILKDTVYKKLEIQDKILFVPISKYQLKLTEYKLRGFCQIMEELGANEIIVDFQDSSTSKKKKELNVSNYNYIAGSLGFSSSSSKEDGEKINYKLEYPKFNSFNLNARVIKSKIRRGKYIISKKNFDSNLELQYIIGSRCNHYITNYSTVFTLDNSMSLDVKVMGKLEKGNFNLGFEAESSWMKNLKLSINTNVVFSDKSSFDRNLIGDNIAWNASGFNFLMETIEDEDFKTVGIYKIMSFMNAYIDNVVKHNSKRDYMKIKNMLEIINNEFEFDEYSKILCDYFDKNAHWLHFMNYLDILMCKRVAYNKLGYLILMSDDYDMLYRKNVRIINFVRHYCINNSLEDKFWIMLNPNDYYYIVNRLDNEYNIMDKYNWFNFKKLINDISEFRQYEKVTEKNFNDVCRSMVLSGNEDYYNMTLRPFIQDRIRKNYGKELKNYDDVFRKLLLENINMNHMMIYDVYNLSRLDLLIENRFRKTDEFVSFYNIFRDSEIRSLDMLTKTYKYDNNDVFEEMLLRDYTIEFPKVQSKLDLFIKDGNIIGKLKKIIECKDYSEMRLNKMIDMLYRSKEDININSLTYNRDGFNILLMIEDITDDMRMIYMIKFMEYVMMNTLGEKFEDSILSDEDKIVMLKLNTYDELVDYIMNYFKNMDLNIDSEFYNLIK